MLIYFMFSLGAFHDVISKNMQILIWVRSHHQNSNFEGALSEGRLNLERSSVWHSGLVAWCFTFTHNTYCFHVKRNCCLETLCKMCSSQADMAASQICNGQCCKCWDIKMVSRGQRRLRHPFLSLSCSLTLADPLSLSSSLLQDSAEHRAWLIIAFTLC